MTRVVHLQTLNGPSGNAAFRLHKGLLDHGVDSYMLSLESLVPVEKRIDKLRMRAKILAMLDSRLSKKKLKRLNHSYGMFSYPILGNNISNHRMVRNADIIYLHWVLGGFLNLKNIANLAKLNKPIIVFMHDMWTITGGCHYSFECQNFTTNCSSCQMFPEGAAKLVIKQFLKKQKLFKDYQNFHFLAPSTWLFNLANKSNITGGNDIFKIPNLVDSKPFKNTDQKSARKILDLDTTETIILFGATSLRSPYKGWSYLIKALENLAETFAFTSLTVAIFGRDYDEKIASSIPFKSKFIGRLNDEYSLATAYNAADVFVVPSVAETFGLVVLEAIRCETPVVAFNTGGIPDIIEHKKNGYLAENRNHLDLAKGIDFCLNQKLNVQAKAEFEPCTVVNQHISLFNRLLNN